MTAPKTSTVADAIGHTPAIMRCKSVFPRSPALQANSNFTGTQNEPNTPFTNEEGRSGKQPQYSTPNVIVQKGRTKIEIPRTMHIYDKDADQGDIPRLIGKFRTNEVRIRSETTDSIWSQDSRHGPKMQAMAQFDMKAQSQKEEVTETATATATENDPQPETETEVYDTQWMIEQFSLRLSDYNELYACGLIRKTSSEEEIY